MKNFIYLFSVSIILFFSTPSQAQYQSIFGDSLTSWKSVTCQFAGCYIDSLYDTGKDTIFGLDTFRIIGGQDLTGNAEFYLFEDTTLGIVYYRSSKRLDTTKYKIMDMSLSKGDTMFFVSNLLGNIVDSVYFVNGRKHVELNSTGYNFTMIEGVGTADGIDYRWFSGARDLICVKKNDTLYYEDSSLTNYDCNSTLTGISEIENTKQVFNLSPNPAANYISLNTIGNLKISTLKIYSISGQLKKHVKNNFNKINVSDLPNGIYYLKGDTQNGPITAKFIKSH